MKAVKESQGRTIWCPICDCRRSFASRAINDIRCLFTMVSVIFQIFADTSGISMERLQELVFQTVLPKTFCCAHLSIQSIVPVSLTIYVFKNLGFGSMVSNFGFMFFYTRMWVFVGFTDVNLFAIVTTYFVYCIINILRLPFIF